MYTLAAIKYGKKHRLKLDTSARLQKFSFLSLLTNLLGNYKSIRCILVFIVLGIYNLDGLATSEDQLCAAKESK